jgi:F-box domain
VGEPTMDPFNDDFLHEHVHRYIFQHLTGKDLLKMSEVSTSWNEVAENQKIGDKVRLTLNVNSKTVEDLKILEGSSRDYKTMTMEFDYFEHSTIVSKLKNVAGIRDYEEDEALYEDALWTTSVKD